MKALYKSAAVCLCTSEYEGFPVALLDAMRMEVPIVALAGTSVSETAGYGSVLDEWDEFVFASHIARLMEEKRPLREIDRERPQALLPPLLSGSSEPFTRSNCGKVDVLTSHRRWPAVLSLDHARRIIRRARIDC